MMLWVAIGGYLIGMLGTSVALGSRLRIASLEQELALCQWLTQRARQEGGRQPAHYRTRQEGRQLGPSGG